MIIIGKNYTEMDEYGYEDYDNRQALLHQVNANNEKLQLKHRFEKMLDAPFFGRVDFMYDGDDEPEPFYIGIGNFAEKNRHAASDLRLESSGQQFVL